MIPDLLRRVAGNAVAGDPYYSAVSLLLHFNGANGSTTFTDSSSNNLTVTPSGNAQISTTQSKFGGAAGYFDGTNSALKITSSTIFDLNGDFTVEGWFYFNQVNQQGGATVLWCGEVVNVQPQLALEGNAIIFRGQNLTARINYSYNVNDLLNKWTHIAITRYGSTLSLWLDGVQVSTTTYSAAMDFSALNIGRQEINSTSFNHHFSGQIDEFRFTVGVARYTANFTVPSGPFPDRTGSIEADAYFPQTSLLLHMDGTNGSTSFVDSGPNTLAVTASGNANISTTQSKFGGASGYFDGTGDYLSLPSSSTFSVGTGDFTIEFWIYITQRKSYGYVITTRGATNPLFVSFDFSGNYLRLTTQSIVYAVTPTLNLNQWYHVAVVRSSGSSKIYVDGVGGTAVTCNVNFDQAGPVICGTSAGDNCACYLDDFRFTTNVARYTSNFTPRAKAFPDIYNPYKTLPVSGAALWLDGADSSTLFTDAGVTPVKVNGDLVYQWNDKSGNSRHATQTTSGNRPTWVPPASGRNGLGALAFNGSSQSILVPHDNAYAIGTNDFTIEAWIKMGAAIGVNGFSPIAMKYSAGSTGTEDTFQFYITNLSGVMNIGLTLVSGSTGTDFTFSISGADSQLNSVWNHVAVCRSGSSLRAFFNGAQVGTTQTYNSSINSGSMPLSVGARQSPFPGYWNGQIQNFLFYNNKALYTANFTPWMS